MQEHERISTLSFTFIFKSLLRRFFKNLFVAIRDTVSNLRYSEKFYSVDRRKALTAINKFRMELARGNISTRSGKLPAGREIYKMASFKIILNIYHFLSFLSYLIYFITLLPFIYLLFLLLFTYYFITFLNTYFIHCSNSQARRMEIFTYIATIKRKSNKKVLIK